MLSAPQHEDKIIIANQQAMITFIWY